MVGSHHAPMISTVYPPPPLFLFPLPSLFPPPPPFLLLMTALAWDRICWQQHEETADS